VWTLRRGSTASRRMGDGVLLYFGYPQAHEDDRERAALAGDDTLNLVLCELPHTAGPLASTTIQALPRQSPQIGRPGGGRIRTFVRFVNPGPFPECRDQVKRLCLSAEYIGVI
jgi:hypothetical protein